MKLPTLGLRGKLAAAALVLATLPWVGWLYVEELERFLMDAQSQALMGTARAIATALHDRPWGMAFPICAALAVLGIFAGVRRRRDGWPFAMTVLFFVMAFLTLAALF